MCAYQADETLKDGPDEVALHLGSTEVNGLRADRLIVRHFTGQEEEVLIFPFDGRRKVVRIVLEMQVSSSTPAVEAGARYREKLQDIPEADEKRLLGLYDRLSKRTYR